MDAAWSIADLSMVSIIDLQRLKSLDDKLTWKARHMQESFCPHTPESTCHSASAHAGGIGMLHPAMRNLLITKLGGGLDGKPGHPKSGANRRQRETKGRSVHIRHLFAVSILEHSCCFTWNKSYLSSVTMLGSVVACSPAGLQQEGSLNPGKKRCPRKRA